VPEAHAHPGIAIEEIGEQGFQRGAAVSENSFGRAEVLGQREIGRSARSAKFFGERMPQRGILDEPDPIRRER
jgi:hypothetical protein